MKEFWDWVLTKGPIFALGLAVLLFVGFHIFWTMSGNYYFVMGTKWGHGGKDVPVGTIVAFYPTGTTLPPDGWVICDGQNGTPDLRNKFIQGVVAATDVGIDPNGLAAHTHSGRTGTQNTDLVMSTTRGEDDLQTAFSPHIHSFETDAASNIPPNFKLIYIMKHQA
jgi:hypothetical protein